MNSKIVKRYTYKNFKLRNNFSINKIEKISFTKHLSYKKEKQNEKALNY